MLRKTVRVLIAMLGALLGIGLVALTYSVLQMTAEMDLYVLLQPAFNILIFVAGAVLGFSLGFWLAPGMMDRGIRTIHWAGNRLSKMSIQELMLGVGGLVLGLFVAFLLAPILGLIPFPWLSIPLTVCVYGFLAYLGVYVALHRKDELLSLRQGRKSRGGARGRKAAGQIPKILDTSVIIDGRILDLCQTGFLEGPLVVPEFVLQELRHISDLSDPFKRNRGRRGLDILTRMQKELEIEVLIDPTDFPKITEVDEKLLALGAQMPGRVVTLDYNLNKVAQVRGVDVLNINDLANALKPVSLPGEVLSVQILREGKEPDQGVAYLEDGTMVVVDGGRNYIGSHLEVLVGSVIQTSAGRMIFAKIREAERE